MQLWKFHQCLETGSRTTDSCMQALGNYSIDNLKSNLIVIAAACFWTWHRLCWGSNVKFFCYIPRIAFHPWNRSSLGFQLLCVWQYFTRSIQVDILVRPRQTSFHVWFRRVHLRTTTILLPRLNNWVARRLLTSVRVRTRGAQGNQICSITPWTLGIQKMYMGTLGYKV